MKKLILAVSILGMTLTSCSEKDCGCYRLQETNLIEVGVENGKMMYQRINEYKNGCGVDLITRSRLDIWHSVPDAQEIVCQ